MQLLLRVMSCDPAPGERVQTPAPDPVVRRLARPLRVDRDAGVVDGADVRDVQALSHRGRRRACVTRARDCNGARADEALEQLRRERRRRLVVVRLQRELLPERATAGVQIRDGELGAVHHRDSGAAVGTGRSGDRPDQDRVSVCVLRAGRSRERDRECDDRNERGANGRLPRCETRIHPSLPRRCSMRRHGAHAICTATRLVSVSSPPCLTKTSGSCPGTTTARRDRASSLMRS